MNPYYEPYWLNVEELEHYGVKGMRWGKHVKSNEDARTQVRRRTRHELSNSKTPALDARALGYKKESRTDKQSATYNKEFDRVAKRAGVHTWATDPRTVTKRPDGSYSGTAPYGIRPTAGGYSVYRTSTDEEVSTMTPEELQELKESGQSSYKSRPIGTEFFTSDLLRDAEVNRKEVEKLTSAVVTTKDIGKNIIKNAMSKSTKSIDNLKVSNKKKKTIKSVLSGAASKLVSSIIPKNTKRKQ